MLIQDPITEIPSLSETKKRLLAQRLKGSVEMEAEPDRIEARRAETATLIGPEQYSVWLDVTLQPDVPAYNEVFTVRYHGDVDVQALEAAFNAFVARHEAWRAGFVMVEGEVHLKIAPRLVVKLPVIDLAHLTADERERESLRIAEAQAVIPITLEDPPLFRATLVRLAADDCRLHLVLHHLIFDGFSLRRTFLPELATLYNGFVAGVPATLPPLAVQYGDFALWRRQQADSPAMDEHLAYWRKQLAGELPVLRLPSDRSRPAVISRRGNVVRFDISQERMEALRVVAKASGASLYMALLATFKILLFRYSAQEDLIVGSVSDGRRRSELQGMIGYALDIFALRTSPAATTPFSEYLRQVKRSVLEAFSASEVPFERVVSALGQKRDLSHQPVFQTVFAFQPTSPYTFADWEIGATAVTTGASKFDLYVEADERTTHTAVRVHYSTDLFDARTIERMAGHWSNLIEAAVANPATLLGDLNLLTPAERQMMLVDWNRMEVPLPPEPALRTMHGLVSAQVARTPDAPAVSFEGMTLSFAEVEAEASRIAYALALAGARPDTLAAIFLDRSEHLVTGLLAILKTGAAYMPLDPGTPAARIRLCLEDATPAVILTQRSRAASLPKSTSVVVILEDILEAEDSSGSAFVSAPADPQALAYIIHTSGSTGRPKGVELRHEGVANLLLSMQREPGLTASDVLVAVTTISFDIAVLEIFLPLITGARVVIASRETALDPTLLADLVRECGCTVLQATPATWSSLLGSNWQGQKNLKALCGGEALNRSLADRLIALGLELWNVYGPTETTIWSTVRRVLPVTGVIPVGRPIANTTTYILDTRQNPVPIGVAGELYIGGIGVAQGYRNKPELTAEKFVTPAVAGGARVYRTGDNALYRVDGTIEVQGRADNQVKIRGYRIELEDVEVNLTAHPAVAFAAAKAWPDETGGYRLAAYLVGVGGPPPSAAELRQFLRKRVADYMIPSDIIPLEAMPLTSNGKIDRKQLLEPVRTKTVSVALKTALEGEELRLAAIWSELLQVETIAATDNFFDLGGHSLMLLKMIRLINKEFSIELPITRLFQAPTIEKLAAVVRELSQPVDGGAWSSLIPLNPRGPKRPFFLIHSLMLYGRLPAALGPDQPFYALQPLPFGSMETNDWVDRMLEDHLRQIKRVQPQGPYQLAGWCFAGWMAYEIARRLEAGGDQVSVLAMLDSWCPYNVDLSQSHAVAMPAGAVVEHTLLSRVRSLIFKIRFRHRQFSLLSRTERRGHIRRMLTGIYESFAIPARRKIKAVLYRFCLRFNLPKPKLLRDPSVVTYEWLRQYRVQPYHGDITLVRPGDLSVPPNSDPYCGWRALTDGEISSAFIPGDRSTMFLMPNLSLLAECLNGLMARK